MIRDNSKLFDAIATDYDNWFDLNENIFLSEVNALKFAIPAGKNGIEIGAGTGRFAKALNIPIGVEPSGNMAKLAQDKGIITVKAFAENLPFYNNSFDFVLFVTTVCFLKNIKKSIAEVKRILKPNGAIVIGFIDKDSPLGKEYKNSNSKIYKKANFYTIAELTQLLSESGFDDFTFTNTLNDTYKNDEITELVIGNGCGKGNFIIINAFKK